MKLLYLGVVRNFTRPGRELVAVKNTEGLSFFERGPVAEFLSYFSALSAEKMAPGSRNNVEERGYTFHIYSRSEGVAGVAVTDAEYPTLVAHRLLTVIIDEFLEAHPRPKWESGEPKLALPSLGDYIVKYQDPKQQDSLLRIQAELDETKITMHKTIESVLQRGEKLDDLVARSEGLSTQSKMFYKTAKKQNSCCVVM